MNWHFWLQILTGGIALSLLIFIWILWNLRNQLYLMSPDSTIKDQHIISVTGRIIPLSAYQRLITGQWKTDVDLRLRDFDGNEFFCLIRYHLLLGYRMIVKDVPMSVKLNSRLLQAGNIYRLKKGQQLQVGNRKFEIVLKPQRNAISEQLISS